MSERYELKVAVEHIEAAFKPLECFAEIFDYNKKVRFRVYDAENIPLIKVEEALARQVRDPSGLAFIINEVRNRIANKGTTLDPWSLQDLD